MKNIVILSIVLLLNLLSSCTEDPIIGSDDLTSEFRNVASFTKFSSEGVFEVMITQGNSQSVEIIANENIIHKVKTIVINNELRLFLDDNNYKNVNLKANIIVPNMNSIRNFGDGNILALNIDNENFNVDNSGSGDIRIEGNTQSLTLKNEGSGKFEGFLFAVNDSDINIIGSGDCHINCANNLNVRIEGSGDVYYIGSPIIEADISGSGKIVNAN